MRKLVWTALVSAVSAAAAALAVRALDRVWRQVTSESPPEPPKWARFLVGNPLRRQVASRVFPQTPT